MKQEPLAQQKYGPVSEGPQAWIFHGILGSKQNWAKIARELSAVAPDWIIRTVDLPCHGDSAFTHPPYSLSSCVRALTELEEVCGIPSVVIGHSFGGKVALCYGADRVNRGQPLQSLWTLDSPLGSNKLPSQGEVAKVISACLELTMPIHSRKELVEYFQSRGFARGIGQWLTTNLKRSETGFDWRFNLQGIKALLDDYWRVDAWNLLEDLSKETHVTLLKAEQGLRWTTEAEERIQNDFPQIDTPILSNSGHWVHVDQPKALIEMLRTTLIKGTV